MKVSVINRNEQLYGPSPKVLDHMKSLSADHLSRYTEDYYRSPLRDRLAEEFNLPIEQIIVGYGIEDILRNIFLGLRDNQSVLASSPSYNYYKKYLDKQGIKLNYYDLEESSGTFIFNIDRLIEQYGRHKPKILIITSPNNPTGNAISPNELKRVLSFVDETALVILDEAYWGFDDHYDQSSFLNLLSDYRNLLILRSFSKIYGLAGSRIGFGLCGSGVLENIRWQHQYLGFSRILEEIAIVTLDSKEYYSEISRKIIADREWFVAEVNKIKGLKAFDSKANFVLISFDKKYQLDLEKSFAEQQEIIAKIIAPGQMRVTIGLTEQIRSFIKLLIDTIV